MPPLQRVWADSIEFEAMENRVGARAVCLLHVRNLGSTRRSSALCSQCLEARAARLLHVFADQVFDYSGFCGENKYAATKAWNNAES